VAPVAPLRYAKFDRSIEVIVANTVLVTTRIKPSLKRRIAAIARATHRSQTAVMREAIEGFLDVNDHHAALIRERLAQAKADARAGQRGISHVEVDAWLKSWGTKKPLPRPR